MVRFVFLNHMWKLPLVVILAAMPATSSPTKATALHQERREPTYASVVVDEASTAPVDAWHGVRGNRALGWEPAGEVENDRFDAAPLSVILSGFYAEPNGDSILVTWETATELDNSGFNLWRGTSESGPDTQLNTTLIPSQGPGSPGGFVYTWEDRYNLVSTATYHYWLDSVDFAGVSIRHGPVSATYYAPTAVGLGRFSAAQQPPSLMGIPLGALPSAAALALVAAAWLRRRNR